MNRFDHIVYARTARLLHEHNASDAHLQLCRDMLAETRGDVLISALLDEPDSKEVSPEDLVARVQSVLEALARTDLVLAVGLMARLWPVADRLRLHDICDAIDLWIAETKDPRLLHYLEDFARNEPDAALRRHYRGWCTNLNVIVMQEDNNGNTERNNP
jgi:hypothetical protein